MTDERTIGELDPVVTLLPAALIEIEQSLASFNATIQQVLDLVPPSGLISLNADTTAAQIIAAGTGLGIVDAGATHTLSIDATVATLTGVQIFTNKTITSFTNFVLSDGEHLQVRNESGVAMSKGDVVFISGYNVGQDLSLVILADASVAGTMPSIGIVNGSIANNANGEVCISGSMRDIDTASFTSGDILYVSEVAGEFTNVKPTGAALIQNIATVLRSHATLGVIEIHSIHRTNDLPNIPSAQFWLGNASGVPTAVTMSGDVAMINTGATTIQANTVDDGKITTHTSTKITITAKGQLNSAIVYDDQANSYTAGMKQSFVADATNAGININNQVPSTTVGGDIWRATDALTYRNNADTLDLVLATLTDISGFFDTAGTGLTSSGTTVNAIGTASRISVSADAIDIDSGYVGQTSITTLGTITTGVWNGTAITYANLSFSTDIVNADISATAAIAFSKLAALTSTNILVGNATNVATSVAMTGDVTISNAGVTTIGAAKVTISMLANGVDGELITWDAAGAAATVGVGTVGQLLQSNGAGVAPTFEDAPTQLWTVLGDYEASIAESSHEFSFTAVDFDDDSFLFLTFDGGVSSQLALELIINGDVTGYSITGFRIDTVPAQTLIQANTQTEWSLASTNIVTDGAGSLTGNVIIQIPKGVANNQPSMKSDFTGNSNKKEVLSGQQVTDTTSISSVQVQTSTSTWRIGTRITLYKVSRA